MASTNPNKPALRQRKKAADPNETGPAKAATLAHPEDQNIKTGLYGVNTTPSKQARAGSSDSSMADPGNDEQFGLYHQLPLIFVLLPTIGSALFGRAEVWTDFLLLTLVVIYLYQLVRVPWDVYYSSRRRRKQAVVALAATQSKSHREKKGDNNAGDDDDDDDERPQFRELRLKEAAVSELRRMELVSLVMTLAAPWLGSRLLYWIKPALTDPDRYINAYSIRLFTLASGVKPFRHFFELMNARALHLQTVVSQPTNDEWTSLVERLNALESSFNQLLSSAASKIDVRSLKEAIDAPMTELVRAVSRHDRKQELIRVSAQGKLEELTLQMADLDRESEVHEQLLEALSAQVEEARQRYLEDKRQEQWIKLILFGSASCTPHPMNARVLLKSALHVVFLPLTAPWQASTLLLRYAGRRLFLPAPPQAVREAPQSTTATEQRYAFSR